jgi:predicted transcriptional regulator
MSEKETSKSKAQAMKDLRAEHQDTVDNAQALLKEQGKLEREIMKLIEEQPRTVAEIASLLDLPPQRVLWFLTALKKYNLVRENGMEGEYIMFMQKEE